MIGSDPSDMPAMKRWLAFLEGGLLPIISLTSLHFFVKYEAVNTPKEVEGVDVIIESESVSEEIGEEDKSDNLQDVANRVWEKVSELREEGKLPEITEEDLVDEPTALAFTPYDETIPQTDEVIELSEDDSVVYMDEIDNPKFPNDILKKADIIVSDNHVLPVRVYPNVILMGSFLWHDVNLIWNKDTSLIAKEEHDFIKIYKPDMLFLDGLAMPEVLNCTHPIKLPWFCNKLSVNKSKFSNKRLL
jgi:hypothetical protein